MISRIFRGENENVAVKRKRQIDTLKIFNDNVVELREDMEYQVQFNAGERRMAIMVSLSPEFPLEKPVLRVSPPINHPWCNEHSEITSAPGLLNFTVHSDLGRVVQAIIREFSKNPPQLLEDISPGSIKSHRDLQGRNSPSYTLQRYPDIPATSFNSYYTTQFPQFSSASASSCIFNYNHSNSSSQYSTDSHTKFGSSSQHSAAYNVSDSRSRSLHNTDPTTTYKSNQQGSYMNSHYSNTNYHQQSLPSQMPTKAPQSDLFPELNSLSNEELKRLSEDEDRLDEFLEKHSELKNVNAAIDDAIDWVQKTAETNVAKEPELRELQSDVANKVQTVAALKARYDQLIQRYNNLSEVFTPDHIKECLRKGADESHEESERIAEDFLNRKIDVERFLSTYIECRKLGQARRTKEEKLAHQLNELKRAGY
ncbi:PREDICTED: vacuolar protein sorting-associated protein 37A [Dufourea novaeangliae]|uniref:Vacuolar protein sorting-associated protein 37A n=1 Tax=Dufourea novaeangliae TaxID=178035 RepID=A0A154PB89_DUFNO|nr:PREDICTED: vacuolar protein sorting-associated protein 37A [Dufourea novaeangliae]KZC09165.1 Vacuolar protein sorting-associated protein 37A [Dufourea novaeangliae]